ncbi:MAG: hypothetical protein IKS41_02580 [Alphaproteobacteria bacterium]|nr:hypothetical protein [Alphaproteobacteria bacterium]
MISFIEFVNKVENAKPPILKKYKKKVRLTNLQGIGLCLLVLFSFFVPIGLWGSYEEHGRFQDDDLFVAFFFLITLGIGWAFSIYSIKHFTLKEKRKIYNPTSPTKLWDALVVISAICVFFFGCTGILPDFISISLALLSILCPIGYFLSPWRERQVKARIPLFQLLSILGWEQKLHDEQHPFFFSKYGKEQDYQVRVPYYFCFKLNGTPVYIGDIQFWHSYGRGSALELETITFNIPDYNQDENIIVENIKKFISSPTGQDLFFHQSMPKYFVEKKVGRLEISFPIVGDIEVSTTDEYEGKDFNFKNTFSSVWADLKKIKIHPNFYQNTYFYYTREDLDTIYKDVQTLLDALDSRYF